MVIASFVAVGIVVAVSSSLTEGSSPQGPGSSSYSPTSQGLAGLSELLARNGAKVVQLTVPLGRSRIVAGSTLVIADPPSWQQASDPLLLRTLAAGGTVVIAGPPPPGIVRYVITSVSTATSVPVWSPEQITRAVPSPDARSGHDDLLFGVTSVRSTGPGSWVDAGPTTPVLVADPAGDPAADLALEFRRSGGTLVLLASAAPLQDRLLASSDNAAFALDVTERLSSSGVVYFDEYDHGYGVTGGGLSGLPVYWKAGLILVFLAALVWLASASRRFGPPEEQERVLAPPRVQYVDAMSALFSTSRPEHLGAAVAPLSGFARRELCRRARADPASSDEEVANSAIEAGFDPDLVESVLTPVTSAEQLVAIGRAAAELSRREVPTSAGGSPDRSKETT